ADGDSIASAVLNAQGYIEVTFADSGDGLDVATIDGDELSLSGTGVGTVALVGGAPILVSGTTYQYAFAGDFTEGTVNVDFVGSSFTDLAATPNTNVLETESFTVSNASQSEFIVDNADGTGVTLVGSWGVGAPAGTYGADQLHDFNTSKGAKSVTFAPSIDVGGSFEVYLHWTSGSNRAANAPVAINHSGGTFNTTVDQTSNGSQWNLLGTFSFNAGSAGNLVLSTTGTSGFVIADAARFVRVAPAITSSESSSESSLTGSSAITSNNSYQLASGDLVSGGAGDTAAIDTDGDGVADHKDLFPEDADFARVSDYVDFIIDYLVDDRVIFDEDWKELQNEAEFTAELEAVLGLVLAAEQAQDAEWAALLYMEALGIIDDELLIRTDGFQEGGSHETDWIIIKEAQDIVYPDLLLLSEYLWLIGR
ncbi:hypothetical protein N9496_07675, partial [Akkermansiaceae bacterium]|nr:hypothetical protein [Akkermansiaceae bacterium]